MGGRHVPAVPRLRVRSVQGVLAALLWSEEGAAWGRLDHAVAPYPQHVAEFLHAPPAQHRRRDPHGGGLRTAMSRLLDVHADEARFLARMAEDIRRGLTVRPRELPPAEFYPSARASPPERSSGTPPYYLTGTEELKRGRPHPLGIDTGGGRPAGGREA